MIPARRLALQGLGPPAHAGLYLTRYLRAAADASEEHHAARDALANAAREAITAARSVYTRAFTRWKVSLPDDGPTAADFRTEPRLVIGLGSHTVLETGLTLHHTYGSPLLPGAALKGLAAHYCHTVWGTDSRFLGGKEPGECYRVLFGTQDEGGLVTFHDAWITPDTLAGSLLDDVMTPHHGGYYMHAGPGDPPPPADYDDPVPVAFLAVAGTFRVAVTADPLLGGNAERWARLAFDLLAVALSEWGIGGKTASGYGRLTPVTA